MLLPCLELHSDSKGKRGDLDKMYCLSLDNFGGFYLWGFYRHVIPLRLTFNTIHEGLHLNGHRIAFFM